MKHDLQTQCAHPAWFSDALEVSSPSDDVANKRSESRREWISRCLVTPEGDTHGTPITVQTINITSNGIGFLSREEIKTNSRFKLTPADAKDAQPVHVRVVHCTQTIQGYKVGCSIE